MNFYGKITGIRETEKGTDLLLHIPDEHIQKKIIKFRNDNSFNAEIRIDDNRTITAEQRKKIYAIIKDIALYTGDIPEYLKEFLKFDFCQEKVLDYFSLSDCSITMAREFINYLMDFILKHDIPISEEVLNRTDDIDHYLWGCIKYKKCCICGRNAEIHHWDAIGQGRNRAKIDDSDLRKIALCREHHTEAHTIGQENFMKKYHVYGIIFEDKEENHHGYKNY